MTSDKSRSAPGRHCRRGVMTRQSVRIGLTVAALAIAVAGCGAKSSAAGAGAPPPSPVGVVVVQTQPVSLTTELNGRTSAFLVSDVRPQVGGVVQARLFKEGSLVRAGQVLYQI